MDRKEKQYVQVGIRTMRGNGDYELAFPLYVRVSDEKGYSAKREKCLSAISQMVIEKYRDRLQSTATEGGGNG